MNKYILYVFLLGICLNPTKGFSWSILGPDLDGILVSQETAYAYLKACKRRDNLSSCEKFDDKISDIGSEVDKHRKAIDKCASEGNSKCEKILNNLGLLRKERIMLILSE